MYHRIKRIDRIFILALLGWLFLPRIFADGYADSADFNFGECLPRIVILAVARMIVLTKGLEPIEMLAFSDF
jgi:hypothetical protein